MSVDSRLLDRIDKLMKLAAPDSGTTDHERTSAALEAARLYAEHGVTLSDRQRDDKRPHRRDKDKVHEHAWVLSIALQHAGCSACGGKISRADAVFIRVRTDMTLEYLHNMRPCSVM